LHLYLFQLDLIDEAAPLSKWLTDGLYWIFPPPHYYIIAEIITSTFHQSKVLSSIHIYFTYSIFFSDYYFFYFYWQFGLKVIFFILYVIRRKISTMKWSRFLIKKRYCTKRVKCLFQKICINKCASVL
jgi:hypothetical protein